MAYCGDLNTGPSDGPGCYDIDLLEKKDIDLPAWLHLPVRLSKFFNVCTPIKLS